MRTISEVHEEMNDIQVSLCSASDLKATTISKLKKRYEFLMICKRYLATNPPREFLESERDRLTNKINLINANYVPNQRLIDMGLRKEEQAEHKDYNKVMSMPKWKDQLRSIQFLMQGA